MKPSIRYSPRSTTIEFRKRCAAAAFALSAAYDASISAYFASQLGDGAAEVHVRPYIVQRPLKYGCNPHQKPAAICSIGGQSMPFDVLNGNPGYINLLDACNAWQLVHQLRESTGLVAATSFKHVSPAGAALAVPLTVDEATAYEVTDPAALSPAALAYTRARNADPMSSFGDFVAISDEVDESAAMVLKVAVSDGIIAPGYTERALEILKAKKKGNFVILQADAGFEPSDALEFREVMGMAFLQKRNVEVREWREWRWSGVCVCGRGGGWRHG